MHDPGRVQPPRRGPFGGWRTAAAFGPAAVVLLLGTLVFVGERLYTATVDRVLAVSRTEVMVERALGAIRDAEVSQRGYLISGARTYRDHYEEAAREARTQLAALIVTLADSAAQAELAPLVPLGMARLARLDTGIALHDSVGRAAALEYVRAPAGAAMMDSLRRGVAAFQAGRDAELEVKRQADERYERLLHLGIFAGTPIAVLLALVGSGMLARAERVQLALAERAVRENDERRAAERAVQAASLRARVLAGAGSALTNSLDADQALEAAARAAVPLLADLCVVDLVELDGRPRRAGVAHADPDVVQLVRESATNGPRTGALPPDAALTSGESIFVPVVDEGALERVAGSDAQLAAIRAADPGSLIAVPMRSQGRLIGALTVIRSRERDEPFDRDDLATAEELARRTAAAVESSRMYRLAVAARAEAEEANRAKSTFLATMSHELRTPLNAVLGYVDLLDAEVTGPLTAGQRDYVSRIGTSGRHLLNLIAEILDLAKVEAGQMRVRMDRLRLAPVLSSAAELVRPLADARRIALTERCPADIEYCGDEDRVRQVLVNLLSNAVKFTEPGGAVAIECEGVETAPDAKARLAGDGPWVSISVRDTGIGIPPEKLEPIFAPFVQVESGHTRGFGGTGLGLSISRSFARLMEGDLTVESQVGEGSTFTLWLPAPSPAHDAVQHFTSTGEWRPPTTERRIEVGRAIGSRVAEIVRHVTARLREDPAIPNARIAAQADLEDHIPAFVAELGQSLTILDAAGADRENLARDGSELQRRLSEMHGVQRRRLGWDEAAIRREFAIVAEELEHAIRRSFGRDAETMAGDVVTLLRVMVAEATEVAVESG